MFILKKGHQPGVYVPLRALFLVFQTSINCMIYVLGGMIKLDEQSCSEIETDT